MRRCRFIIRIVARLVTIEPGRTLPTLGLNRPGQRVTCYCFMFISTTGYAAGSHIWQIFWVLSATQRAKVEDLGLYSDKATTTVSLTLSPFQSHSEYRQHILFSKKQRVYDCTPPNLILPHTEGSLETFSYHHFTQRPGNYNYGPVFVVATYLRH